MNLLFIGGTGRLSKDVALRAVEENHNVYLLTRGSSTRNMFVDSRYHMLYEDIRDKERVRNKIKDLYFDVVIDFLSYEPFQLLNTLSIIEGKFDQYIFISTAAVYKRIPGELISEDKTPVGNDRWTYAYRKFLCEQEIRKYFSNRSEKFTIIRPAVTYGDIRIPYPIVPLDTMKEYSFLFRVLNGGAIPVFNYGDIDITLTHTRDFAKGVVGLMKNQRSYGEAFHITSNERLKMIDVLLDLELILNIKINKLYTSQESIYKAIPYYKDILLGDKGQSAVYDNSKILNVVDGLSFDIPLFDGLKETVSNLMNNESLQLIDYRWMGNVDRLAKKEKAKIIQLSFSSAKDKINYICGRYKTLDNLAKAIRFVKSKTIKG